MPQRFDGSLVDDLHQHLTPQHIEDIHNRRRKLPREKVPSDVPDLSSFGPPSRDEFGPAGPQQED